MDSISKSALAVTRVLLGQAPDELPPLKANELATETVWLVAREQSKYWKSIDPKACDPQEGRPFLWCTVNFGLTVFVDFEPISFSIPGMIFSVPVQFGSSLSYVEILKAHRQHDLYTNYGMMQVPMMTQEHESLFASQIMCT